MADIPPPPPPGPQQQPPPYQPPAGYQPPPPASPGYMPSPITPGAGGGLNIGAQVVGAGWSIGVGLVGIAVPIVSAFVLTGSIFYFYLLPLFGVIYGVRAIMRGFLVGGLIGIGLNIVAGLVSLTAAGLINPGG
jgi:hypothetical protein